MRGGLPYALVLLISEAVVELVSKEPLYCGCCYGTTQCKNVYGLAALTEQLQLICAGHESCRTGRNNEKFSAFQDCKWNNEISFQRCLTIRTTSLLKNAKPETPFQNIVANTETSFEAEKYALAAYGIRIKNLFQFEFPGSSFEDYEAFVLNKTVFDAWYYSHAEF